LSTKVRNQIHTAVDRLFPGFLDEKKTGIAPFSKSSLYLMKDRFSAARIRRKKTDTLTEILRQYGTQNPERAASKLKEYAKAVLIPPNEYIGTLQVSLAQHVRHYRCIRENIEQLEKEIALWLAQTQGAFLTTVRGIGIVLAAGVTAEIGDPIKQKPLNNLVSYAGIIPRVKQTGGPEGNTYTGKVAKRCNRLLKNYVVQSGLHLGLHGPEDLMTDFRRREASGQHADFGIARRYLRMGMCLMRTSQVYLPQRLRNRNVEPKQRASYYLMIWPKLRDKWSKLDALNAAFADDRPLGKWRNMVQELYGITLKR
jgi:transposase